MRCPYCAQELSTEFVCQHVASLEFRKDGSLKRVAFHAPQPLVMPAVSPSQVWTLPDPIKPQPWKLPEIWAGSTVTGTVTAIKTSNTWLVYGTDNDLFATAVVTQ